MRKFQKRHYETVAEEIRRVGDVYVRIQICRVMRTIFKSDSFDYKDEVFLAKCNVPDIDDWYMIVKEVENV